MANDEKLRTKFSWETEIKNRLIDWDEDDTEDTNTTNDKKSQLLFDWRDDKTNLQKNLSDWTITVKCMSENEENCNSNDGNHDDDDEKVYRVHRVCLVHGGSIYFERLFASKSFQENENHKSTFEFHDPKICNAIPVMLDYLYMSVQGVDFVAQMTQELFLAHVVGLRFLSTYFGIQRLRVLLVDLLSSKYEYYLSPKTCLRVLQSAHNFGQDSLLRDAMVDYSAYQVKRLPPQELLSLEVDLFQKLLNSDSNRKSNQMLWSTRCYEYIVHHNNDNSSSSLRSSELFQQLTRCNVLPELSLQASLGFLQIIGNEEKKSLSEINYDDDVQCRECEKKECLASRCTKCLGENIGKCKAEDIDQYLGVLGSVTLCSILKSVSKSLGTVNDEMIIVADSGVSLVNGTYIRKGKFNGYKNYEKEATVDGEETIVAIRVAPCTEGRRKWWILDRLLHAQDSDSPLCYFMSDFVEGIEDPINCTWEVATNGSEPLPSLRRL